MTIYLLIIGLGIILDQLFKWWVVSNIPLGSEQDFLGSFMSLLHINNYGAAWGIFHGRQTLLTLVTFFALILLGVFLYSHYKSNRLEAYAYSFIITGALGNFIDRVRQGYVTDMFHFKWIDFPIFNIADIFITVGVLLLILQLFNKKSN
ncbi:signal peptidase II [Atopobacter phocae]|uniref:signal peptidase II n=1 Tax=Atopobacter phocae TaxID=136492 RepID=UPI000471E148|nr:signal peptidase II [Atopobacter phocae]